jgi:hypothetical protein
MNQNPIDRLAAIRQQIRTLRAEQRTIRNGILAGQIDPHGEAHTARVRRHVVVVEQSPASVSLPLQPARNGGVEISEWMRGEA